MEINSHYAAGTPRKAGTRRVRTDVFSSQQILESIKKPVKILNLRLTQHLFRHLKIKSGRNLNLQCKVEVLHARGLLLLILKNLKKRRKTSKKPRQLIPN